MFFAGKFYLDISPAKPTVPLGEDVSLVTFGVCCLLCRECDSFSHEQLRHCPFCVMDDIANIDDSAEPQPPLTNDGTGHAARKG